MNPLAGRVAFSMGLTVFLLALITLPFLDPSSPEFVADAIALALSGIFVGLVVCSARRAARLPAIERLPDDASRPGRPDDDIDQPG
jgi:hypothetical protein